MKTIIKIVFPVVFGVFGVLALLALFNIFVNNRDVFSVPDNGFLVYFVPATMLIAMIIQIKLTLPLWRMFRTQKKVWGFGIIKFTLLISSISGLIFGFVFWERDFGTGELLAISLTGIIAFSVYWSINLMTLRRLDKLH